MVHPVPRPMIAAVLACIAVVMIVPPVARAADVADGPPRGERILVKPAAGAIESAGGAGAGAKAAMRTDGGGQPLWIDPTREAVLDNAEDARSAMRIRDRLSTAAGKANTSNGAEPATVDADGSASPVFVDAAGNPRALPGGVIVTFAEALPDSEARARIAGAGGAPARAIGPRSWLVDSAGGIAALQVADALRASGAFASVEQNWWRPPVLK